MRSFRRCASYRLTPECFTSASQEWSVCAEIMSGRLALSSFTSKTTSCLGKDLKGEMIHTKPYAISYSLSRYSKPSDELIEKKKFQCGCGKSFKEARHLAVHANSHLPDSLKFIHHCTFCSKKYSSVFSLRHHIKHVHVNVSLVS